MTTCSAFAADERGLVGTARGGWVAAAAGSTYLAASELGLLVRL